MDFDKRIEQLKEWERAEVAESYCHDDSTEEDRKLAESAAAYHQRELQNQRAALVRAERDRRDAEIRSAPSAMALAFAKAKAKAK